MAPDPGSENKARAIFNGRKIGRWTAAILAAASAFLITVGARAFLYKGHAPGELPVWAVATVVAAVVGTVCAPPQHSKASRSLFIGLAVSVSVILLLGGVAARHKLEAVDIERVAGAVVGGITARFILRRA
jgi:hypothetical protein